MKKRIASKETGSPQKKKEVLLSPVAEINRRKEWRFELPLRAIIEGKLPHGKKFKESTTVENISSGGAYFCLDSGLIVGSKLNLVLDLPKKLAKDKRLKLFLGGITVRLEEPNIKGKKQGVAVRFNRQFKFIAEGKTKKAS
jgi:c-di-GMP-binding flagellar brake protein YcgR